MGIGKRIKEARKIAGLTQEQLAKKIGVTASSITNYENGTSHPKEKILYDLMNNLSVDANFLFQDEIIIKKNELNKKEMTIIKKYRSLSENDKKAVDNLVDTLSNKPPFGYDERIKCFTDVYGARAFLSERKVQPPVSLNGKELSDDTICELATEIYNK